MNVQFHKEIIMRCYNYPGMHFFLIKLNLYMPTAAHMIHCVLNKKVILKRGTNTSPQFPSVSVSVSVSPAHVLRASFLFSEDIKRL